MLDTNDAYLKQEMDATNRAVNALRNDKTITIPAFTQSAAPYTADIEVQHLKTTDAIELYAGMIKSDSELTAVSYTHLDVYKRQGKFDSGKTARSIWYGRPGRRRNDGSRSGHYRRPDEGSRIHI